MGRRRVKPFIDKHAASTYHLLHRSQRDVATDVLLENSNDDDDDDDIHKDGTGISASGMILWPSPNNHPDTDRAVLFSNTSNSTTTTTPKSKPTVSKTTAAHDDKDDDNDDAKRPALALCSTTAPTTTTTAITTDAMMREWRQRLAAVGLVQVDSPDRYLKEISESGIFLDARTGRAAGPPPVRHDRVRTATTTTTLTTTTTEPRVVDPDDAILEVNRQLDSIPLTTEFMDDDIAQALMGEFDDGDFEELNDDFVYMAAGESDLEPTAESASSATATATSTAATATFDYDDHIRRLLDKARQERLGGCQGALGQSKSHSEWAMHDSAFFSGMRPLHEEGGVDDNDNDTGGDECEYYDSNVDGNWNMNEQHRVDFAPTRSSQLDPADERALCDKFHETLLEYDSDDIGAGSLDDDEDDDDDDGRENNDKQRQERAQQQQQQQHAMIEAALDDFMTERADYILMQGRSRDSHTMTGCGGGGGGGSGFSALVGTRMVPAKTLDAMIGTNVGDALILPTSEPAIPVNELLQAARDCLAEPIRPVPPEEIFMDGKSYFSERQRNPWDCETILSTYSNVDNHPTIINGGRGQRQRRSRQQNVEHANTDSNDIGNNGHEQLSGYPILLSAKTGLPLGVLPSKPNPNHDHECELADATAVSINRGEARARNETATDKKHRKAVVKQERQLARLHRKTAKAAFAEEFQKHSVPVGRDDMAGKTVFRF